MIEKREKFHEVKYLNAKQVCELYPFFPSPGSIRTLASRRKIPFRKVNGRLIFLKSEIDEWIENSPGLNINEYQKKERR
jgi:predicted DNA-binding transcriptional regulator AlpA